MYTSIYYVFVFVMSQFYDLQVDWYLYVLVLLCLRHLPNVYYLLTNHLFYLHTNALLHVYVYHIYNM
jgi:hypothetical protein